MSEVRLAADIVAVLGESPLWIEAEQALYWIDGQRPHLMRLADGAVERRVLPYRPSCLVPLPDGRLLVGYKKGIGVFAFATGEASQLPLTGVDLGAVSLNDGKCDQAGRLWIGTRHRDASEPAGALYRIDAGMAVSRVLDGLVVSNGIAFSPDGRTMYHTDSRPGRIDAYDYDPAIGTLSGKRLLLDYAVRGFRPDGCTVDTEGGLWVAEIDGGRVSRYRPDGTLDRSLALPVSKPSSVGFGGPGMRTLFITTISYGLGPEQLAAQPWAGKLLQVQTGFRGIPEPPFRL